MSAEELMGSFTDNIMLFENKLLRINGGSFSGLISSGDLVITADMSSYNFGKKQAHKVHDELPFKCRLSSDSEKLKLSNYKAKEEIIVNGLCKRDGNDVVLEDCRIEDKTKITSEE